MSPLITTLRVFGCACWPNLRPYNARKLMFRSQQCVFLGHSAQHKGVKCLDIPIGHVYISRDVVFDETQFPFEKLHPNAGALLRKEILLLPSNLIGVDCVGNDDCIDSITTNSSNSAYECAATGANSGENDAHNGAKMAENGASTHPAAATDDPT